MATDRIVFVLVDRYNRLLVLTSPDTRHDPPLLFPSGEKLDGEDWHETDRRVLGAPLGIAPQRSVCLSGRYGGIAPEPGAPSYRLDVWYVEEWRGTVPERTLDTDAGLDWLSLGEIKARPDLDQTTRVIVAWVRDYLAGWRPETVGRAGV